MVEPTASRILVIKLAALGDFVQAIGPFAAIRRHHADTAGARVTLLTTAPYAPFAEAGGWFDEVWTDERPPAHRVGAWLALRRRLRAARFSRVYDLQTSDRSAFYYRLFWPGPMPEWSGIARGCSHPHANPRRDFMHTLERQKEQLRMAGIAEVPEPDLSWVEADTGRFQLAARFGLVVAGGAPHRPEKRWPAESYAVLAGMLDAEGIEPVLLGAAGDRGVAAEVCARCPAVRDLTGQTELLDIAALARGAACAVGNDTGPMHLIAMAGCPSVVLYSHDSDPALCAQHGSDVTILRRPRLAGLAVGDVMAALKPR
jgi:ADP-heptose:LPS heptosyltransferase